MSYLSGGRKMVGRLRAIDEGSAARGRDRDLGIRRSPPQRPAGDTACGPGPKARICQLDRSLPSGRGLPWGFNGFFGHVPESGPGKCPKDARQGPSRRRDRTVSVTLSAMRAHSDHLRSDSLPRSWLRGPGRGHNHTGQPERHEYSVLLCPRMRACQPSLPTSSADLATHRVGRWGTDRLRADHDSPALQRA
jgi:hypothetical protein